jgi:hypothetical protein
MINIAKRPLQSFTPHSHVLFVSQVPIVLAGNEVDDLAGTAALAPSRRQ